MGWAMLPQLLCLGARPEGATGAHTPRCSGKPPEAPSAQAGGPGLGAHSGLGEGLAEGTAPGEEGVVGAEAV